MSEGIVGGIQTAPTVCHWKQCLKTSLLNATRVARGVVSLLAAALHATGSYVGAVAALAVGICNIEKKSVSHVSTNKTGPRFWPCSEIKLVFRCGITCKDSVKSKKWRIKIIYDGTILCVLLWFLIPFWMRVHGVHWVNKMYVLLIITVSDSLQKKCILDRYSQFVQAVAKQPNLLWNRKGLFCVFTDFISRLTFCKNSPERLVHVTAGLGGGVVNSIPSAHFFVFCLVSYSSVFAHLVCWVEQLSGACGMDKPLEISDRPCYRRANQILTFLPRLHRFVVRAEIS